MVAYREFNDDRLYIVWFCRLRRPGEFLGLYVCNGVRPDTADGLSLKSWKHRHNRSATSPKRCPLRRIFVMFVRSSRPSKRVRWAIWLRCCMSKMMFWRRTKMVHRLVSIHIWWFWYGILTICGFAVPRASAAGGCFRSMLGSAASWNRNFVWWYIVESFALLLSDLF